MSSASPSAPRSAPPCSRRARSARVACAPRRRGGRRSGGRPRRRARRGRRRRGRAPARPRRAPTSSSATSVAAIGNSAFATGLHCSSPSSLTCSSRLTSSRPPRTLMLPSPRLETMYSSSLSSTRVGVSSAQAVVGGSEPLAERAPFPARDDHRREVSLVEAELARPSPDTLRRRPSGSRTVATMRP